MNEPPSDTNAPSGNNIGSPVKEGLSSMSNDCPNNNVNSPSPQFDSHEKVEVTNDTAINETKLSPKCNTHSPHTPLTEKNDSCDKRSQTPHHVELPPTCSPSTEDAGEKVPSTPDLPILQSQTNPLPYFNDNEEDEDLDAEDSDISEETESESTTTEESTEGEDDTDSKHHNYIIQERLKELDKYAVPAKLTETQLISYNPAGDFHHHQPATKMEHPPSQNVLPVGQPDDTSALESKEEARSISPNEAQLPGLEAVLSRYHSTGTAPDGTPFPPESMSFYHHTNHNQVPLHVYTNGTSGGASNCSSSLSRQYCNTAESLYPSSASHCLDYPCPECGQLFEKKSFMRAHLKTHFPNGEKRFKCTLCPYSSHYQKNLEKHINSCHGANSQMPCFFCDICGTKFTDELELSEHRKLHTGDNTYACIQCTKHFKTKLKLKYHMDVHNPKKQFKCDMIGCDRAFSTPKYLNNHRNEYHKLQPKHLECPVENCREIFQRKSHLNRHMVIHGEQVFHCPYQDCNRSFRSAETLRVHQTKHTGQKPFACDLCDFACRQRSALNHHYREIHAKDSFGSPLPPGTCFTGSGSMMCGNTRYLARSISTSSASQSPCKTSSRTAGDVYTFSEFDSHAMISANNGRGNMNNCVLDGSVGIESKIMSSRPIDHTPDIMAARINSFVDDILSRKVYSFFNTVRLTDEEIILAETILEESIRFSSTPCSKKRPAPYDSLRDHLSDNYGNSFVPPAKESRLDSVCDLRMDDLPPLSVSQFDEVFGEVTPEMLSAALSDGKDLDCNNPCSPSFNERSFRQDSGEDCSKSTDSRTPMARLSSLVDEGVPLGLDIDYINQHQLCADATARPRFPPPPQQSLCVPDSYYPMNDGDLLDEVLQDLKEYEQRQQAEKRIEQQVSIDQNSGQSSSSFNGMDNSTPLSVPNNQMGGNTPTGGNSMPNSQNNGGTPMGPNATPANTTPESQWSDSDYSLGRDSVGQSSNAPGSAASAVGGSGSTPSGNTSFSSSCGPVLPPIGSSSQPQSHSLQSGNGSVTESNFTSPNGFSYGSNCNNTYYNSPVKMGPGGVAPNGVGNTVPSNSFDSQSLNRQASYPPDASGAPNHPAAYMRQHSAFVGDHNMRAQSGVSYPVSNYNINSSSHVPGHPGWQPSASYPTSHSSSDPQHPSKGAPLPTPSQRISSSGWTPGSAVHTAPGAGSEYPPGPNQPPAGYMHPHPQSQDYNIVNRNGGMPSSMSHHHAAMSQQGKSEAFSSDYHNLPPNTPMSQMGSCATIPGYDKYPGPMYGSSGGRADPNACYPGSQQHPRLPGEAVGPYPQKHQLPANYRYVYDGKPMYHSNVNPSCYPNSNVSMRYHPGYTGTPHLPHPYSGGYSEGFRSSGSSAPGPGIPLQHSIQPNSFPAQGRYPYPSRY